MGTPPSVYGIVTTAMSWFFIRWIGSLENPIVEISQELTCGFEGEMQNAKKVLARIVKVLQVQDNVMKDVHESKHTCFDLKSS